MNDDPNDSKGKRSDGRYQVGSREAFRREMALVEMSRVECDNAINDHDFEAVQHLMDEATKHWMDGRDAYRRVIESLKPTSPLAIAMRTVMNAKCSALIRMCTHAVSAIEVPSMQERVERARRELARASAEPLVIATANPADRLE